MASAILDCGTKKEHALQKDLILKCVLVVCVLHVCRNIPFLQTRFFSVKVIGGSRIIESCVPGS
jgi:hypothetical protein